MLFLKNIPINPDNIINVYPEEHIKNGVNKWIKLAIRGSKNIGEFTNIRLKIPLKYIKNVKLQLNGHDIEKLNKNIIKSLRKLYNITDESIIPFHCCSDKWFPIYDNVILIFEFETDQIFNIYKNQVFFTYEERYLENRDILKSAWNNIISCKLDNTFSDSRGSYPFFYCSSNIKEKPLYGVMFKVNNKTEYWRIENGVKLTSDNKNYYFEKTKIIPLENNYYFIYLKNYELQSSVKELFVPDIQEIYTFIYPL